MIHTQSECDRFAVQDTEYSFPYHYLTDISSQSDFSIHRSITWGLEYLTYITWVRDQVKSLETKRLIDVGCGDGRLLNMLSGVVPIRAGVDLSGRALVFARAFNPGVEFFNKISEVNDKADIITCVETLEHVSDAEIHAFVESMAGKLIQGGKLILTVPTVAVPLNRKHYRHYTLNMLEKHLSPFFKVELSIFLFRRGVITNTLNRMLSNRFFILENRGLKRNIWRFHKRWSYIAAPDNGAHLAVVCGLTS